MPYRRGAERGKFRWEAKCVGAADCVAFELYLGADGKACYIFRRAVEPPFTAEPACLTCVRNK